MTTKPLSSEACTAIEEYSKGVRPPQACETWEERGLGNQFFRKMRFELAGDYMRGHLHAFDHNTIIFTGAVRVIAVKPDGEKVDKVFSSPRQGGFPERNEGFVCIRADTFHEIIAVEDNTEAWCCFSHRDDHGEVVQEYQGRDDAYASA